MIPENLDALLRFVILAAGEEDLGDQELGPIHLVKYAYLGDMAYAMRNEGKTFTETPWVFYHFGPWDGMAFSRIEPVVREMGAEKRVISSSTYDKDFARYKLEDHGFFVKTEQELPFEIVGKLRMWIREYGSDTDRLLAFVYTTPPMLNAAPEERLEFGSVAIEEETVGYAENEISAKEDDWGLSKTQKKKLKAKIQEGYDERVRAKSLGVPNAAEPAPRYDELFESGAAWLDSLDGARETSWKGTVRFSKDIWKSEGRRGTEIP